MCELGHVTLEKPCKLYTGSTDDGGYGTITYEGKTWRVHRLVFFLVFGWLPEVVMHRCDTPACYEPTHLFGGTRFLNNRDRDLKGRNADTRGEKHGGHRLKETDVLEIRRRLENGRFGIISQLAREYGVHHDTIRKIGNRKLWSHV